MARATQQWTISLPPQLSQQAMRLARQECRTKSELVREALRGYLARQNVLHAARRQLARNIGKLRLRSWADLERVMGRGRAGKPVRLPRRPRRSVRRRGRALRRRR
jgi:predicted transcriptional regulator